MDSNTDPTQYRIRTRKETRNRIKYPVSVLSKYPYPSKFSDQDPSTLSDPDSSKFSDPDPSKYPDPKLIAGYDLVPCVFTSLNLNITITYSLYKNIFFYLKVTLKHLF